LPEKDIPRYQTEVQEAETHSGGHPLKATQTSRIECDVSWIKKVRAAGKSVSEKTDGLEETLAPPSD
jgi:hypothetical protein